jgi:UDP-glucose 4-epimerase
MRVAVIGASGNVGTALLRRFVDDQTITSVLAIARRPPPQRVLDTDDLPSPYDVASWVRCDVGAPADRELTVNRLAAALLGADAVVHLAWALHPAHDRAAQRRTNVRGTRVVADAVLRAGVPHLVVASSVGVYSPAPDAGPRSEDWPTGGVRSCAYSADKVAAERVLDEIELLHPDLVVARVRPALVFQAAAGRQVTRNFLGALFPTRLLARELPVLPWPRGSKVQAVHAADLAAAIREVVVRRQRGAFNVAAADVLRGEDLAVMMAGGRLRELSPAVARAVVAAAWHARLVPVSPGWMDLAASAPVLDCTRAHHLLGWQPTRSSAESVAEVLAGIAQGAGTASPPLRPRRGTSPG